MLDAVIFEGNYPQSPVEEMLVRVRHGALADSVPKLLSLPEVARVFLVTNRPELAQLSTDPRFYVKVNRLPPTHFHFGRQLLELVDEQHIGPVLCLGGAAVPLISREELALACRRVLEKQGRFVTNNVQSADIIGFNPATALRRYPLPATDNSLALLLRYEARFEQVLMPATLGSQFDIDTPSDLLVLGASPFGGAHLRAALAALSLDLTGVERLKDVLRGDYLELALIGRVGAPAMARLNSHFKVRLRVFSEERGMKALGRLESGEVVSLLGFWLMEAGPEKFFQALARVAQAALIDTRVLFAHLKRELSDADRFYSDLGQYEKVSDVWTREFTHAAVSCGLPLLLGGHSLVSGCLFALTEELGCLL
ncbi:MAG: hypothetical protein KGZ57_10665 [Dethiobacter sp.]|nr:hypothetical protein [Dethiobacter sp.]